MTSGEPTPGTGVRALPSVDRLVRAVEEGRSDASRSAVVDAARAVLAASRADVLGGTPAPGLTELVARVASRLVEEYQPSLRRVINATGVLLHTNLGRAPLSDAALRAVAEVADGYGALEFDLDSGDRGSRSAHISDLIARVTGAEAGLAVNNNAGATLLCLTALTAGREVIVSRGQAVEIGGGFRIPDVLRQSGAVLVEVGTTNRTYAHDYEEAITPATAALLHVHSSNFRVVGFTHEVALSEMADLARRHGLALIDDNGSGALLDTAAYGLPHEPTVQESVAAGSTVVCFSGDKLLGGPQAGLICGQRLLVGRIARHPLARALRIDKLSLAALAATLRHYARGEAASRVPVWTMMALSVESLEGRARMWASQLADSGLDLAVVSSESAIGGGSLPGAALPTRCLSVAVDSPGQGHDAADSLVAALRRADRPVVGRVERGRVLLDPRTVQPLEDAEIVAGLIAAAASLRS